MQGTIRRLRRTLLLRRTLRAPAELPEIPRVKGRPIGPRGALIHDPDPKRPFGGKRDRDLQFAQQATKDEMGQERQHDELLDVQPFSKHFPRPVTPVMPPFATPTPQRRTSIDKVTIVPCR